MRHRLRLKPLRVVFACLVVLLLTLGGGVFGGRPATAAWQHIYGTKLFLGYHIGFSLDNIEWGDMTCTSSQPYTSNTLWASTSLADERYGAEVGVARCRPAWVDGTNRPYDWTIDTWYYWAENRPLGESDTEFRTYFVERTGGNTPALHYGIDYCCDSKWRVYLGKLNTGEYIIPKSNLTTWQHGTWGHRSYFGGESYDTVSRMNFVRHYAHKYHCAYGTGWHHMPNDDGEVEHDPFQVRWITPPHWPEMPPPEACVSLNATDQHCEP